MLAASVADIPKVLVHTRRGNCRQFILLFPFLCTCIFVFLCLFCILLIIMFIIVQSFFVHLFLVVFLLSFSTPPLSWRVLRWMHTLRQPSAFIGFVTHCINYFSTLIQYLLAFRKAYSHGAASAFGGCAGINAGCFIMDYCY